MTGQDRLPAPDSRLSDILDHQNVLLRRLLKSILPDGIAG
jgi:hypothetical protein